MNIKKIFSCLFAAISLFFFFSCGGSASDSSISFPDSVSDTLSNSETSSDIKPHTHTFGNWRETLAKTCVRDGMQTRECTICGYSETHSLPASGHLFSDGICGSCGTAEPTDGLVYEISQDGSHYLCTGIGTAGTAIVVSDFFEGKRVTEIASGAFQESGLVSVTVPAGIEKIGGGAFYRCETLTAVTLCEGLTQIGANAFSRCAFSSFSMPDTLITVGTGAFQQCTKLRKINFSQTLESIGNSAFQGCTTITAIELPATLTQIGQSAFYGFAAFLFDSSLCPCKNFGEYVCKLRFSFLNRFACRAYRDKHRRIFRLREAQFTRYKRKVRKNKQKFFFFLSPFKLCHIVRKCQGNRRKRF